MATWVNILGLTQTDDKSPNYKQICLERTSVPQRQCPFPVTGGTPVRSRAILRRTRPNATCIIAHCVSPVFVEGAFLFGEDAAWLEVTLSPEEKPINAVARVVPLIFLAGMPGGNGAE